MQQHSPAGGGTAQRRADDELHELTPNALGARRLRAVPQRGDILFGERELGLERLEAPPQLDGVGVRPRLNEDLYLNFGGMSDDNKRAVIQAYVFPLVSWIWIGFWILAAGTVVCLIPSKVRLQYARTEVVGISRNYAEIQK